jgi:hypothetical protein
MHGNFTADTTRFGYSFGAFQVLCHIFRRGELPNYPISLQSKKSSAVEKSRAVQAQLLDLRRDLGLGAPTRAAACRPLRLQTASWPRDVCVLVPVHMRRFWPKRSTRE